MPNYGHFYFLLLNLSADFFFYRESFMNFPFGSLMKGFFFFLPQ